MAKYAERTTVPVTKSKQDIERALNTYGVEEYAFGTSPRGSGIIFKYDGKVYKINVSEPDPNKFRYDNQLQQAIRSRWRVLLLCIKAKLNLVQDGQSSFEDEFLAYMSLPEGITVAEFMRLPKNVKRLEQSKMPLLLTGQHEDEP